MQAIEEPILHPFPHLPLHSTAPLLLPLSLPLSVLPWRQPHGYVVPVCLSGANAVLLT